MDSGGDARWEEARRYLRDTLSEEAYTKWIADIQCVSVQEGHAVLAVANDFYLSWLEDHYLPLIKKALSVACNAETTLELKTDGALHAHVEPEPQRERIISQVFQRKKPEEKNHNLNKHYTFDHFVVGGSNEFAHAASMAVAQTPGKTYNPLFINGGVGLGKTHLMQAVGHFILSKKTKAKICYTTSEAFTNEYIEALQSNSLAKFRKKYRTVDALLIDDIQFLAGKEKMQEEFFHTFNELHNNHRQIVLTSDRPASELSGLAPRLISRFEWGLGVEIIKPDLETRVAILKTKCTQLNLTINPELLFYIAERISSNIRRLEGALIKVATYASLTGKAVDRSMLENLLKDTLDQEKKHAVSVEVIQRSVADHYDLRVGDLVGPKRPKNIAWPRQVAMYLSRSMTDQSYPEIGRAFNRNHATIVHACREVEKRQTDDLRLRQTLSLLQQRIGTETKKSESAF
jgi:chromosomal replication initiator protein